VELLPQAPVNNVDESGLRVAKTLHWLHVASNDSMTFYGVHPKRGAEAMDYFNIPAALLQLARPRPLETLFLLRLPPRPSATSIICANSNSSTRNSTRTGAREMSQFLLGCRDRKKKKGVLNQRQHRKSPGPLSRHPQARPPPPSPERRPRPQRQGRQPPHPPAGL